MSFRTTSKVATLGTMRAASEEARRRFGEALKHWRQEHDYTQEDLAQEIPCSYSIVSKWESGKTTPGSKLLRQRIKEITGLDVDEILFGGERAQQD